MTDDGDNSDNSTNAPPRRDPNGRFSAGGSSHNPKGRPRKSTAPPDLRDEIARLMVEEIPVMINGKRKKLRRVTLLATKAIERATTGNTAFRLVSQELNRPVRPRPRSRYPEGETDFSPLLRAKIEQMARRYEERKRDPENPDREGPPGGGSSVKPPAPESDRRSDDPDPGETPAPKKP
jgi:Family of unknown function (DUF5681)